MHTAPALLVFDGSMQLPVGVELVELPVFADVRGSLTMVWGQAAGQAGSSLPRWHLERNVAGSLRGMKVHPVHDDHILVVLGSVLAGLHDLRRSSPTFGLSCTVTLAADDDPVRQLRIPHGVAHGFFSVAETCLLVGADHGYDPADEVSLDWQSPEVAACWTAVRNPLAGPPDGRALPYDEVVRLLHDAAADQAETT